MVLMEEMKLKFFILCISSFFIIACASNQHLTRHNIYSAEYPGYVLTWIETLPGEPEREIRMLVAENYLRIEETSQQKNFIIFDKQRNLIYEYKNLEANIIKPKLTSRPKNSLPDWVEKWEASHVLERNRSEDNNKAIHYQYSLNSEACYNVVSVKHYLQDVLPLMRAYQTVRSINANKDTALLADKNQACYSAVNFADPNKRYEKGFPIREWSVYGYRRFLVNYKIVKLSSSYFDFEE